METTQFDACTQSFAQSYSRRGITRLLAGFGLGGPLALLGRSESEAKCKKIKGKKKRKACRKKATGTTDQLPGDPAAPQTTAVTCPGPAEGNFFSLQRFAHTFTAPLSGQLTSAQVEIESRADNDYTVEIRPLDGAGVPTASVLASARIENVAVGPQTLTATFAAPPAMQAGTGYALVVTGDPGQIYALHIRKGNDCPGQLFGALAANDTLVLVNDFDMIFSVTIVG